MYFRKIDEGKEGEYDLFETKPDRFQGSFFVKIVLRDYSQELKGEKWLIHILGKREKMIEAVGSSFILQLYTWAKTHPYVTVVHSGNIYPPGGYDEDYYKNKREYQEDLEEYKSLGESLINV
jgi:hypothetical protein